MKMSNPINKPKADESAEDDFVLCDISSDEEPAKKELIDTNEQAKTIKKLQQLLDEKTRAMQMLQIQISELKHKNMNLLDEMNENETRCMKQVVKDVCNKHIVSNHRYFVWFISMNVLMLSSMYWLTVSSSNVMDIEQYECKLQMMNNSEFEQYHQTMQDNESLRRTVYTLHHQLAPKDRRIRTLNREIVTLNHEQNDMANYAKLQRKNIIKLQQKMENLRVARNVSRYQSNMRVRNYQQQLEFEMQLRGCQFCHFQ